MYRALRLAQKETGYQIEATSCPMQSFGNHRDTRYRLIVRFMWKSGASEGRCAGDGMHIFTPAGDRRARSRGSGSAWSGSRPLHVRSSDCPRSKATISSCLVNDTDHKDLVTDAAYSVWPPVVLINGALVFSRPISCLPRTHPPYSGHRIQWCALFY